MSLLDAEALACAETLFAYHLLGQEPRRSDVMMVLGTNDTRVAEFASQLYVRGLAPCVVVTGGIAHTGDLLATGWNRSEAEVFAQILVERGVPKDRLLLETNASNTAENIAFSKRLLESQVFEGKVSSVLYACKPFMPRRVAATHAVEWPEMPATVATWRTTFADYCNDDLPQEKILNILMGDTQRLWIYAKRGYSAPQRLPADVQGAFRTLCAKGFTQHLVPGEPQFPPETRA